MGGSAFCSACVGCAAGDEYGVGVGVVDPTPVFAPGRFSVGRSEGVGVDDGGGVGDTDCAAAAPLSNDNTMNNDKFRMNSFFLKLLLTLYREDRILCWKTC